MQRIGLIPFWVKGEEVINILFIGFRGSFFDYFEK